MEAFFASLMLAWLLLMGAAALHLLCQKFLGLSLLKALGVTALVAWLLK